MTFVGAKKIGRAVCF